MEQRVATLEAYSKVHKEALDDLKKETHCMRQSLESLHRDLHAAKWAGRMMIGAAMAIGSIITWIMR